MHGYGLRARDQRVRVSADDAADGPVLRTDAEFMHPNAKYDVSWRAGQYMRYDPLMSGSAGAANSERVEA